MALGRADVRRPGRYIAPARAPRKNKKSFTRRSGPCKKRDRKEEALSGDGCKMDERCGAEVARVHANLIRKHDETDKTRFQFCHCMRVCWGPAKAGAIAVKLTRHSAYDEVDNSPVVPVVHAVRWSRADQDEQSSTSQLHRSSARGDECKDWSGSRGPVWR